MNDNLDEPILDRPLCLVENDRLALRDIGARQTLGAAQILSLSAPKRGKRSSGFLVRLVAQAMASDVIKQALALLLLQGALCR